MQDGELLSETGYLVVEMFFYFIGLFSRPRLPARRLSRVERFCPARNYSHVAAGRVHMVVLTSQPIKIP